MVGVWTDGVVDPRDEDPVGSQGSLIWDCISMYDR
jgi:hypothetical protein